MFCLQSAPQPQAAGDQAENAKLQAEVFGMPEIVEEFTRPLPEEIEQVRSCFSYELDYVRAWVRH
jgi:hypothetical protein